MSSSGRFARVPLSAAYLSSKHALVGLVDALAAEVRPFGISISLVTPGTLRTHFAHSLTYAATRLPVYEATTLGIRSMMNEMDRNQSGDAARAAQVIYRHAVDGTGAVRDIILGSDALDQPRRRAAEANADVDAAWPFALAVDFCDSGTGAVGL